MTTLPREIVDYIFILTDDIKTCVLNRRTYAVYKLYKERNKKLMFQKDPDVIKYYFDHLLPIIVHEFNSYAVLKHMADENGSLELVKLVITKMKQHRIYTKWFNYNIKYAFENACLYGHLDIMEYLNNEYNGIISKSDFRWISEKVTLRNRISVIRFLHYHGYLWYSFRGVYKLKKTNDSRAEMTLRYIDQIRKSIPCNRICYRN